MGSRSDETIPLQAGGFGLSDRRVWHGNDYATLYDLRALRIAAAPPGQRVARALAAGVCGLGAALMLLRQLTGVATLASPVVLIASLLAFVAAATPLYAVVADDGRGSHVVLRTRRLVSAVSVQEAIRSLASEGLPDVHLSREPMGRRLANGAIAVALALPALAADYLLLMLVADGHSWRPMTFVALALTLACGLGAGRLGALAASEH